jgi:hypothetical protein
MTSSVFLDDERIGFPSRGSAGSNPVSRSPRQSLVSARNDVVAPPAEKAEEVAKKDDAPSEQMVSEEWRPVTGSPGYAVSNLGRVRGPMKILKPRMTDDGYVKAMVTLDGGRRVGRLALFASAAFSEVVALGFDPEAIDGGAA